MRFLRRQPTSADVVEQVGISERTVLWRAAAEMVKDRCADLAERAEVSIAVRTQSLEPVCTVKMALRIRYAGFSVGRGVSGSSLPRPPGEAATASRDAAPSGAAARSPGRSAA